MTTQPFTFNGRFQSYLKLWCENNLLLIVSFGLLLPWTLLRKKRYFYQHTQLEHTPFSFTAKPTSMFFGIGLGLMIWLLLNLAFDFIPYATNTYYNFILYPLFFNVISCPLLALFANQALAFRRRHSNYRGVNFSFQKKYREAFVCMAGFFILSPLSIFLAYPYFKWRFIGYRYHHTHFGGIPCHFSGSCTPFYGLYLRNFLYFTLPACLMSLPLLYLLFQEFLGQEHTPKFFNPLQNLIDHPTLVITLCIIGVAWYLLVGLSHLSISITNFVWNQLSLGNTLDKENLQTPRVGLQLHSQACVWRLVFIRISNFLIILGSFGLLTPLATIRTQRFWTETKACSGALEHLVTIAQSNATTHALGEGVAEISGLDLGM